MAPTNAAIIRQVQAIIRDPSYSASDVLFYLNQGLREVAGALQLPALAASASVQTARLPIVAITRSDGSELTITTLSAHGLVTNDVVYISNVVGTNEINSQSFIVTVVNSTQFKLNGAFYRKGKANYSAYIFGTVAGLVKNSGADVVVTTSSAHQLSTGNVVTFNNVGGMTELNNNSYTITVLSDTTFSLDDTANGSFSTWTSGGNWYTGFVYPPFVSMPSIYHKDLYRVYSVNLAREIKIEPSFKRFRASYPNLNKAGSIETVCVVGNRLYYQPIPTQIDTLHLAFYRFPTEMANDSSYPDGLPDHSAAPILINYAAKEIYLHMGMTELMSIHEQKFQAAISDLKLHYDPEDHECENILDDGEYIL